MPHLHLEYSAGLERRTDIADLCRVAHGALIDAGPFPLAGIRVRAFRADHAIVADGLAENDFLAMTLSVGSGRDTQTLQQAGEALFRAMQDVLAQPLATPYFALSLEIRVMDPALSWKDTPIHARLSGRQRGSS